MSGAEIHPRLIARTTSIDAEVDPLALAGDDGLIFTHESGSLAGSGAALRIELPRGETHEAAAGFVAERLGAIESQDSVGLAGCGPVAFGALLFAYPQSESEPANLGANLSSNELVVPQILVGRDEDGARWLTTVYPESQDRAGAHEEAVSRCRDLKHASAASGAGGEGAYADRLPGAFAVAATMSPDEWCRQVERARDKVRSGALRKVVLAREVGVRSDWPISRRGVLERLADAYPGCMLFAFGQFVGASPELLVARRGDRVRSHPLAGTAPRSADARADNVLASELRSSLKNREEHRITIDMVHDALIPYCSYLDEEAEPSIVPMANVMHLGTMVEGRLSTPAPSVLELALTLHPTPAVGGWPTARALALIGELEGIDRGRYAGPVGWVDAAGNGEWAVGIRSAEIDSDGLGARLFAGVGVVADSDPISELAETRAKFQAMLGAIIRP